MSLKEMLESLNNSGWSQSALARELGVSQPTIHRMLEKGQGCSYDLGKKIEALYLGLSKEAA